MKKLYLILLCVVLLPSFAYGEGKQLDLNLDADSFYEDKNSEPSWYRDNNYQDREQKLAGQCQEMQKQIRDLKGRPQQKFTLQQRYDAECAR